MSGTGLPSRLACPWLPGMEMETAPRDKVSTLHPKRPGNQYTSLRPQIASKQQVFRKRVKRPPTDWTYTNS